MFKFDETNLTTGYIKQLLHFINLPCFKPYRKGIKIYPNQIYLYKNMILKSNKQKEELGDTPTLSDYTVVATNYTYNQKLINATKSLELNSLLYDSYTHKFLGEYLRFIRDYFNVNLMSMYNCFSKEYASNIESGTFNTKDDNYLIYVVPVKFYQAYTIGIDCDTSIEIQAGYYSKGKIIPVAYEDFISDSYMKKTTTEFKRPFLYDKLLYKNSFVSKEHISRENILTLFLKLPASCKSSITILEGDYTKNSEIFLDTTANIKLGNRQFLAVSEAGKSSVSPISRLQLFYLNDQVSYPFADRLVEYLFENVIYPLDKIDENIKQLQIKLYQRNRKLNDKPENYYIDSQTGKKLYCDLGVNSIGGYGIWDDSLTDILYQIQLSSGLIDTKFDLQGYVDKDTEYYLGGDS